MKGVHCVNSELGVSSNLAKMSQHFMEANAMSKTCKTKAPEKVIFVRRMRAKPASRLFAFIFVFKQIPLTINVTLNTCCVYYVLTLAGRKGIHTFM